MPPEEAAKGFKLPPGFRVTVFAAEPDVRNPIALTFDPRGRLWVAENDTYAEPGKQFDERLRDRVIIYEDTDNDGRSDRRTVFTDAVRRLTSVEVGRGGVWLMCPPALLFLPDRDGDDRPDGPAEVVLDGFTVPPENHHNFANGLKWGPDGWLYGRCGASAPGDVGRPGTPPADRIPLRGTIWRYHPERKVFEALAGGTTNPWGHDWNSLGEPFFINTVNGHLWHLSPGAHYVRPHTVDPNPYVYEVIDQHADHWHWDNTKEWQDSRKVEGEHDRRGGGHAHSGMMIYLGNNWPDSYRDQLMTLNLHGRRMNVERLERAGAGYVGKHEPDTFFAADPNFRGIDLTYGPDGGVYVLDWSDTGECHEHNGVQRSSGRIYKVTHGRTEGMAGADLRTLSGRTLAALQDHVNEWYARQSRRVLADLEADDPRRAEAVADLRARLGRPENGPEAVLRPLWTLHAMGAAEAALLRSLLDHPHEAVRAWAIRLLTDALPIDTALSARPPGTKDEPLPAVLREKLVGMAGSDPSGLVRLTLASTLQRLPVADRPALATALASHAGDANDHDLPLMVWYGCIPVVEADPSSGAALALSSQLPTVRRLASRRLAEDPDRFAGAIAQLVKGLDETPEPVASDILAGLAQGLRGRRKAPKPDGWDALAARLAKSEDSTLRDRVRELGVVFGDGRALDDVRRLALDDRADLNTRRTALATLIESRPDDLRVICEKLLNVRFLNATAVRGLALYDDPALGAKLAGGYRAFHPSERGAVLAVLIQRPAFAAALLDAVAAGRVPKKDITAYHARQILSFHDESLAKRLAEVWGELRESPAERQAEIAALKSALTPEVLAKADPSRGRAVFNQVCASCHQLYGEGRAIGPDLTGAGRDNLDYLLGNILDPGAAVSADFRMTVVALTDGRVLNGLVRARTDRALTLQTQTDEVVLPRDEIDEERVSTESLMPTGLLQPFSPDQVRDLFAYLQGRAQVPLPAGEAGGRE
jgi:putative membrane-bound dehydrogenase-like protein